jgi:hypothetical protein
MFDIETSPCIGFFWKPGYKLNISYDNIIHESAIICIGYKWEGQKKVYTLRWDENQCDKKMLQEFINIINEADEIVGHNGDKFDITWLRTRCLFHRIPFSPKLVTIDTLKMARSLFRFNSNRLDYLGQFLGLGNKIKTGYGLWKSVVLHKDEKAMQKMLEYCKEDVRLLERVFERMVSYIPVKHNYAVATGGHKADCPECGSSNMKLNQTRVSQAGVKRYQLECNDCGKFHTVSGKTIEKC